MQKLNDVAREILNISDKKNHNNNGLPKKIHDFLQNVFTKKQQSKLKYRDNVVKFVSANLHYKGYYVKPKQQAAIYNALCLFYLVGTKSTKGILTDFDKIQRQELGDGHRMEFISLIEKAYQKRYIEFYSLGVTPENINTIKSALLDQNFDLFTNKLQSPFYEEGQSKNDISILCDIFNDNIPWQEYIDEYEKAEQHYKQKEFDKAEIILKRLSTKSTIKLPICKNLLDKINEQREEAQEALSLIKKFLI